ncbi:uncharacterized protein LOC110895177 isoform X2 [Helianthus annuus]|uniref:uncharacterized protein LOC110895177 isoform X2 n=1 Tax=Helianthus annuus TaxID=4232 RepID=UPI001652DDDE|nr:uncharacterized protein LOC110895177 isoform X2 [Helianthus annuus]
MCNPILFSLSLQSNNIPTILALNLYKSDSGDIKDISDRRQRRVPSPAALLRSPADLLSSPASSLQRRVPSPADLLSSPASSLQRRVPSPIQQTCS